MATYRKKYRKDGSPSRQKKPWRARVKDDYIEIFLGYYETKEEAEQVERDFKEFDYGT
jgi:hypothetical protein